MNLKTSDQTLEGGAREGGADGSLGKQLRRAREARNLSLREISDQTRITMRHLEAIESGEYKHLPGGIFNKSFIKAYARSVGFDEQKALDIYAREMRERGDSSDEPGTTPYRSRVYTDGDASRSPLVTGFLSLLILGVLVLLVYAGLHYYRRTEGAASDPSSAPAANNAGGATAPTPAPTQVPAATNRLNVQVKATDVVWMRAVVDGTQSRQEFTLSPNETREFEAGEKVTLSYARSKAKALEVTANGTRLNVPDNTRQGVNQEWEITRENFRQYAQ